MPALGVDVSRESERLAKKSARVSLGGGGTHPTRRFMNRHV